jgi:putative ABC transport system ATP-binding protein
MQPLIRTVGLGRDYRMGDTVVPALRDISVDVAAGEFLSIMGPSGSGKSTLMHLLGLLERPTAGRYFLSGEEVSGLSRDGLAGLRNRCIGFVFQAYNLLPRNTAIENVETPLLYAGVGAAERRSLARDALDRVKLAHRQNHWPHQLSGGEQQRVAIARAIVGSPALVLADEPTGALDSATGFEILALFQRLNRGGMTVVTVTHDADVAHHASRILTLRDGHMVSDQRLEAPSDAEARLAELRRESGKLEEMV